MEARISVKVIPLSGKEKVEVKGDEVIVKVTERPEKGRANKRVIELLAETFRIPKKDIVIVKGEKSRKKVVSVKGLSEREIVRRLSGS